LHPQTKIEAKNSILPFELLKIFICLINIHVHMIQKVIKRDGRTVDFNFNKIEDAIRKAMSASEKGVDAILAATIADHIAKEGAAFMKVEDIQDAVEVELMKSERKEVARIYISYRNARNVARKAKTKEIFDSIIGVKNNDITRENANMNADTPAGMMMKFASESTKPFVDDYLLSPEVREAVKNGYIHIHDKDYYPTKSLTCVQHPLNTILQHGLKAAHAESRPAKRIETASVQACISLETAQNEMHGGQAIPALDFYFAPYVRMTYKEEIKNLEDYEDQDYMHLLDVEIKDYIEAPLTDLEGDQRIIQQAINRTVARVHQSMEAFIHNMNTIHSRGGNQVVFSSVNYGTDTSAEGRCVMRELLRSTYEGVGNSATAIFPIQIWKKKRGVNYLPGDPNYDLYQLACKVSARRFFPNFLNLDATYNYHEEWRADDPERFEHEVATMGCRTRVFENRFGPKTSIGRGNLSFTTINIVGLAIECMSEPSLEKRIEVFMLRLNDMCELVAKQLDQRYEFQKTALAKQFPLVMSCLWKGASNLSPNDQVASVINQGTLGIGFIGLAEALIALCGKHHGESDDAQKLGLKIIGFMKKKADEFSERYQHNYSILATPAEGLSGRFTRIDKKRFGIIPGVTDKDYYTNSNHVPVYYKCSIKHKAEVEAPYHDLTRGGHIFYVEIDGDATHNPDTIMKVVDLMDQLNMGYGSVNHNRNRCLECGHEDAIEGEECCPECGSTHIDKLQRITGYLVGTTDRWNSGKLAELKDRVRHT